MTAPGSARTPARRPSRAARRRRRSRRIGRAFLVLVLALLVGSGTFVGGLLAAPIDFAVPPPPKNALLSAADGTQLATLRPQQQREIVPAADIPKQMVQAIISAEDERFLEHKGVDPLATVRAAYRDLTGGRRQGGSTLTQQYVKNVYVGDDKNLLRKMREAALAVRLEQRKEKEEILTDYLNVLYLGNSTYGVQAAAKYYFGVPVKDLDLNEKTGKREPVLAVARATMLAGIAPAPSAWNPVRDFTTARVRQTYVLNRMVTNGYISTAEASEAKRRVGAVIPLQESPPEPPSTAPEFTDLVKAKLRGEFDTAEEEDSLLFRGGLRVKTTLDNDLQAAVTRAAREVLPDPDDPQAAVVAVDIRNGDVKAMTTLRRVPERQKDGKVVRKASVGYTRDGLNLATSGYRSVGSTIKPFTLGVALEKGRTLGTRVFAPGCDRIRDRSEDDGFYDYCNAGGEDSPSRSTTLAGALARSVNTVYVPLAIDVGRKRIKDVMLASGVRTLPFRDGTDDPFSVSPNSFGLGTTANASPLSMATAYATLMNGGKAITPRYVAEVRVGGEGADRGTPVDASGLTAIAKGKQVFSRPDVAPQVIEAMSKVATPAGTAPAAAQDFTVFGKTGTTNDSKDAWFIGCAKAPQNLCMAVWMGFEDKECESKDGRTRTVGAACGGMLNVNGVKQVFGGTLPARIFARAFEILREIKAAKAAAASGGEEPTTVVSPTARPRRSRVPAATPRPTAVATTRAPTQAPATQEPTREPTRPPIVPTQPPPSSSPPYPEPTPSG
ncbi:MAG: transglycosylase domain-containing protein [Mycobacteriales bacterium]|nr:transglycosylase domain-containing protein [Mycobacteriales bacterium]